MKQTLHTLIVLSITMLCSCINNNNSSPADAVQADTTALAIYLDSANTLYDNSQFQSSLGFAKEALAMAESLHDTASISDAMSYLVADFQQLGNADSAIIITKQLIEIDKKVGDPALLASDYNSIAYIYTSVKNYPLAIEFSEKAIEMEKRVEGQPHLSIRYGIAAEAHNQLANDSSRTDVASLREKALEYITMAYNLDKANNDTLHAARRMSVKGDVLAGMQRYSEAEQAYKHAISMLEPLGERHSLAITYRQLGTLYHNQNKNAEAIPLLEKAIVITKEVGELNTLVKEYQQLHEAYQDIDNSKALEYLKLYTQTKDSLYTLESARSLSEFQARYGTDKAEETAAQKHHQLVTTWVLVTLGAIAILAITAWLYILLRRRNRHNKLLHEQIKMLKVQMEEQSQKFLEQRKQEKEIETPEMNDTDKAFLSSVDDAIFKVMGSSDLTVENVASELCITSQQLRRRIKTIKEVTAIAYINTIRIEYAKQLLTQQHDLTIFQIGHLCGYYEATHFAHSFKKETGMTPTQFRER